MVSVAVAVFVALTVSVAAGIHLCGVKHECLAYLGVALVGIDNEHAFALDGEAVGEVKPHECLARTGVIGSDCHHVVGVVAHEKAEVGAKYTECFVDDVSVAVSHHNAVEHVLGLRLPEVATRLSIPILLIINGEIISVAIVLAPTRNRLDFALPIIYFFADISVISI